MTQEQHIAQLAVKHLTGTLSEQERAELTQWLEASPEHRQLFDTYTHPDYIGREYKNRIHRKERLEVRMGEFFPGTSSFPSPVAHRVHFLKTSWFRYAAAVVLIAGAATVVGVLINRHDDVATTNDNKHLQTDIAPGTNKAVLTLADGSKIILDNTANGNVAQQGNTKIIKLDAGQLAYRGTNPPNPLYKGELASASVGYNTIATPRGGQYQITLPDGTKVWLNAASSIKFPTAFTGSTRDVEMTGEIYMEVAKNSKQPFLVKAGGTEVQVLGTSFNINAYNDEETIKTTLITGSIKVSTTNSDAILKPGEQAVIKDHNKSFNQLNHGSDILVQTADIEQALAWKNGMFQFKGATIQEVMRQLSRWYDVEIVYDGKPPATQFEGEMQRDLGLSSALRILELSKIHLRVDGKKIIVTP